MKNKNRWKIGHQRQKTTPFPVVEMKICSVTSPTEQHCFVPECQGSHNFDLHFFGMEMGQAQSLLERFSEREANELAWERAFRMQRASQEIWSDALPMCFSHIQGILETYVGESHEKACYAFLIKAVIASETIFLFDRNLQRNMHHSSLASGHFASIAEFRRKYDEDAWMDMGAIFQ